MTLREGRDGLAVLDRNSRLRLLLVGASAADTKIVLQMLEDEFPHAEVSVELNVEDALVYLAGQRVDLVLADLSAPDVHGPQVVRAVRSTHPETALMVLTGWVDGEPSLWALAEGAHDYLVKGHHDGPQLAAALRAALQRNRAGMATHRYLNLARGLLDALEAPTCAVDSESTIVAVNRAWRDFSEHNGGDDRQCGVGARYLWACDRAAEHRSGLGVDDAEVVGQGIRQVLAGSLKRYGHDYPCHSPTEERWFTVRVTPAVINDGAGAVITHVDITGTHRMHQSAAHRLLHDVLTELPNRVLMRDRLEQAISDADRRGRAIAITHLDLDRYQNVNDQVGYRGGDSVLVQVAERLQTHLRPGDTLARISGDAFMVLWRDLDRDRPSEAVELSTRLVHDLERPFDASEVPVVLSASAGVSVHQRGCGVDELLQSADVAMRSAKSQGQGHVVLFDEELREAAALRRSLEAELRLALDEEVTQFVLHYQPIVNLTSGKVVAVEALVRWNNPDRGLVAPDEFIPLAEATGLIHELGDWVLGQAVHDATTMNHDGRDLNVAINLSARQLDGRAVDKIRHALDSSGIAPGRLTLEVTESAFVEDQETSVETLQALAELGVKVAIDDFGTGYSSLLYLRRYPVSCLKIDRDFVAGIGRSADDEAICESISELATAVDATTVGEGVETMDQYAVLRSIGCLNGQGFLWSRPVPLRELPAAFAACEEVEIPAPQPRLPRSTQRLHAEATATIATMHAGGASLSTIAMALNRTPALHPTGARWTPAAVARAIAD